MCRNREILPHDFQGDAAERGDALVHRAEQLVWLRDAAVFIT